MSAWLNRLPIFRTFEALRLTQERLAATKDDLRRTRVERDQARQALQRVHGHVLPRRRMKELLAAHTEGYRTADPYPHTVIDGALEPGLLEDVLREVDGMDRALWHSTERDTERKLSSEDFLHFGPVTRAVFAQLNAAPFVGFLESLSGITGLIADPHLRGGGLHEIRRDGMLGVHADFNFYRRLHLYRRLNVLLYLNQEWDPAWGGELELWDTKGQGCVRRIEPLFNRMVIFDTSNFHYHGHPHPLRCPSDRARKSLALYYYTVEAPAECAGDPHTTIFLEAGKTAGAENQPA